MSKTHINENQRKENKAFKSINEYFETNEDFDSCDTEFDIIVTCVNPGEYGKEYYDLFTKYIYDNVSVINEETEQNNTVCNWSEFVTKNYDILKQFADENWYETPSDLDDFIYEWIKEINLWLAGYVGESAYETLYKMLTAERT